MIPLLSFLLPRPPNAVRTCWSCGEKPERYAQHLCSNRGRDHPHMLNSCVCLLTASPCSFSFSHPGVQSGFQTSRLSAWRCVARDLLLSLSLSLVLNKSVMTGFCRGRWSCPHCTRPVHLTLSAYVGVFFSSGNWIFVGGGARWPQTACQRQRHVA